MTHELPADLSGEEGLLIGFDFFDCVDEDFCNGGNSLSKVRILTIQDVHLS